MMSPSCSLRRINYWVIDGSKFHLKLKAGIFEVNILRTDNNIKNHFYATLRRSLRRLNKMAGNKNSTHKMREIKPTILTIILNYIYDNQ